MRFFPLLACLLTADGVGAISVSRRRVASGLVVAMRGGAGGAITEDEVAAAQQAWSNDLVEIGAAYISGGDYKGLAKASLGRNYGYASGMAVLFKPTKAANPAIRLTEAEAVSYFIGGDVPEDKGFALAPFTAVRWDNKGTICDSDSATAMGEYFFTDATGGVTKAEYTFEYRRADDGHLRIVVHHSSFPYSAAY